jgi:3-oxoadipate enol-lactonase
LSVAGPLSPQSLAIEGAPRLFGERLGEGTRIVLLHGITATRRYVVHGSRVLPRRGFELISYDARGHGESDPAPEGSGYGYEELAADLARVIEQCCAGPPIVCGHSMGCHTAARVAIEGPERVAGLVLIGPAQIGIRNDDTLAHWDRLADGLERGGVEGFMAAYEADLEVDPGWRDAVLQITRERLALHEHPRALARAIREVTRSVPFDGIAELESLDLPALVVASHDEADPGHPYSVAEAWAERLPRGELISEEPGESPLAWQGGRLSRAIADFCERSGLADRAGAEG